MRETVLRHDVVKTIATTSPSATFLEIETPILTRSTPRARATSSCPAG